MLTPRGRKDAVIPRVNVPLFPEIKKNPGEKYLLENTPGYILNSTRLRKLSEATIDAISELFRSQYRPTRGPTVIVKRGAPLLFKLVATLLDVIPAPNEMTSSLFVLKESPNSPKAPK